MLHSGRYANAYIWSMTLTLRAPFAVSLLTPKGEKMNIINRSKRQAWALCGVLAIAGPVHAAAYIQTNLVASTDAYGASIVDPTLINAWGIAIRPAGLGGHFWVESNGGGTTNQFIGDVGGTPLYTDNLRLVTVPGPATGQGVSVGTPTGVVFNPGTQFTITQGSITAPAKFLFATDTGTISAWTEHQNPDGSFDRPTYAKLMIDRSSADAHYFGIAISPSNDRIYAANFGSNPGIQSFDSSFTDVSSPTAFVSPFPRREPHGPAIMRHSTSRH
jgi:uncharacterized protein (TIGR03118 family)